MAATTTTTLASVLAFAEARAERLEGGNGDGVVVCVTRSNDQATCHCLIDGRYSPLPPGLSLWATLRQHEEPPRNDENEAPLPPSSQHEAVPTPVPPPAPAPQLPQPPLPLPPPTTQPSHADAFEALMVGAAVSARHAVLHFTLLLTPEGQLRTDTRITSSRSAA